MTALVTLNVSVDQIEHELRAGKTVDEVCTEWQEPRGNVMGVLRAMQARGDAPAPKTPAAPVAGARALASVPHPPTPAGDQAGQSGPAVDALVNAAARSTSKRTQALGVKLHDLVALVRARLADEREAAERAEKERADREQAAAEVQRLEAQLRDARAKLGRPKRQGGGSVSAPREGQPRATRGVDQQLPCRAGCDRTFPNAQGRGAHEKRIHGGVS